MAAEEGDDQEGKDNFRAEGPTAKDLLGTDGTIRYRSATFYRRDNFPGAGRRRRDGPERLLRQRGG